MSPIFAQRSPNEPMTQNSACSPGLSRLTTAASRPPVPLHGYRRTSFSVRSAQRRPLMTSSITAANSGPRWLIMGRLAERTTRAGSGVGPGMRSCGSPMAEVYRRPPSGPPGTTGGYLPLHGGGGSAMERNLHDGSERDIVVHGTAPDLFRLRLPAHADPRAAMAPSHRVRGQPHHPTNHADQQGDEHHKKASHRIAEQEHEPGGADGGKPGDDRTELEPVGPTQRGGCRSKGAWRHHPRVSTSPRSDRIAPGND